MNCFYALEEHVRVRPDKLFIIYQGREWTFQGVYQRVLQWANYFLTLGIKPRDVVALNFTNKPSFLFATFGLWSIGATPSFLNHNLVDKALLHCVRVSTARVMLYDEEIATNVLPVLPELTEMGVRTIRWEEHETPRGSQTTEIVSESFLSLQNTLRPADTLRAGQKPTDTAVLIYTSGSTGLPKAAVVIWNKFAMDGVTSTNLIRITEKDRYYTCMPLYHGTAFILGFGSCLATGATLVIGHKFSHKTFWPEVRASKATVIQYVGEACRYMLSAPPSPLDRQHHVHTAYGNGMRPDIWERFRTRFGVKNIAEFYASTEGVGSSFNYNSNALGAGAVGHAGTLIKSLLPGSAIIKVDLYTEEPLRGPDGLCVKYGPGELGEMTFLIDSTDPRKTFAGYFNNKSASANKLIKDVKKKGDTYVRMGDLMSRDSDGFVYFHDRLGDTFRWHGENVSTTEVSEAIGAFPGISEANVYGVQLPNHDGRAGCVAILPDPSVALDLDAFAQHISKTLPKYAIPRFLRFVKVMDVTGNHKHQKVGLRNEGVDPALVRGDVTYWMNGGTYVRFNEKEWLSIVAGSARL